MHGFSFQSSRLLVRRVSVGCMQRQQLRDMEGSRRRDPETRAGHACTHAAAGHRHNSMDLGWGHTSTSVPLRPPRCPPSPSTLDACPGAPLFVAAIAFPTSKLASGNTFVPVPH